MKEVVALGAKGPPTSVEQQLAADLHVEDIGIGAIHALCDGLGRDDIHAAEIDIGVAIINDRLGIVDSIDAGQLCLRLDQHRDRDALRTKDGDMILEVVDGNPRRKVVAEYVNRMRQRAIFTALGQLKQGLKHLLLTLPTAKAGGILGSSPFIKAHTINLSGSSLQILPFPSQARCAPAVHGAFRRFRTASHGAHRASRNESFDDIQGKGR